MIFRSLTVIAVSVLMSGCIVWVDDTQDLKRFVQSVRSKPAGKVEPLPEYKPYESFVYEGSSLREPFRPLAAMQSYDDTLDGANTGFAPDQSRPKEYLEEFSLDDIHMVGTIRLSSLWALVKDPKGAVHRVEVGDHLGLDFGEVVAIEERRMELVEVVSNGRGGWMKRPRVLTLADQTAGQNK